MAQKYKFFIRDNDISFILKHSDVSEAVVKFNSDLYDLHILNEDSAREIFMGENSPVCDSQEKIDAFEELLAAVKEES
jgi:hypothetical protein